MNKGNIPLMEWILVFTIPKTKVNTRPRIGMAMFTMFTMFTINGDKGGMDVTRDIRQGEKVEKELDILITRRHEKRRQAEGERQEEELWRESERRHAEQRREENRLAWCEHFERMRTLHGALADEYDGKLKRLGGDSA